MTSVFSKDFDPPATNHSQTCLSQSVPHGPHHPKSASRIVSPKAQFARLHAPLETTLENRTMFQPYLWSRRTPPRLLV